jgi:hypothetical protein
LEFEQDTPNDGGRGGGSGSYLGFGKVAAFAEICGYMSQAQQIRSFYTFLPDFDEGYQYWRQYLGKYDAVRANCGVVKGYVDQLVSLAPQEPIAPLPGKGEGATAGLPQSFVGEDFDGRWIFEIAHIDNKSLKDRRVIEIKDGKFSVEVSFDGWRGTVTGEIGNSGNLAGTAILKKMKYGRRIEPFDTDYLEGEFHAKTVGRGSWAPIFVIDLTQAAALSD